jgi:hypothetical protein
MDDFAGIFFTGYLRGTHLTSKVVQFCQWRNLRKKGRSGCRNHRHGA